MNETMSLPSGADGSALALSLPYSFCHPEHAIKGHCSLSLEFQTVLMPMNSNTMKVWRNGAFQIGMGCDITGLSH